MSKEWLWNHFASFSVQHLWTLKEERQEVERVILRMGDMYDGMEHFGSYPHTPLHECLLRVSQADVVVLVLAYRHGNVPRGGRQRSMVEREYQQAIDCSIPVIPYVVDREAYLPPIEINPRIVAFRDRLRTEHGAEFFRGPNDLSTQVAADLYRYLKRRLGSIEEDIGIGRAFAHQEVLSAIANDQRDKAFQLNLQILKKYPDSPRAHYNHACILSALSELEQGEKKALLLRRALSRLSDALKYGILKFISLYADSNDPRTHDSAKFIIEDSDLRPLFHAYPAAIAAVNKGSLALRGGCSC